MISSLKKTRTSPQHTTAPVFSRIVLRMIPLSAAIPCAAYCLAIQGSRSTPMAVITCTMGATRFWMARNAPAWANPSTIAISGMKTIKLRLLARVAPVIHRP